MLFIKSWSKLSEVFVCSLLLWDSFYKSCYVWVCKEFFSIIIMDILKSSISYISYLISYIIYFFPKLRSEKLNGSYSHESGTAEKEVYSVELFIGRDNLNWKFFFLWEVWLILLWYWAFNIRALYLENLLKEHLCFEESITSWVQYSYLPPTFVGFASLVIKWS